MNKFVKLFSVPMKKFFTFIFFIVLFVLTPFFVQRAIAQAPPPPPPTDIPIDGGLGFLLAAGIGYAAKKLYSTRKKGE